MKPKLLIIENENDPLHNSLFFSWLAQRALANLVETTVLYGPDGFPLTNLDGFQGIIVGGSSTSVNEDKPWIEREMELLLRVSAKGLPVLGCCFGHQLIAKAFGGIVTPRRQWHRGFDHITVAYPDPLLTNLNSSFTAPVCHAEEVSVLPSGFTVLGSSKRVKVMVMRHGHKPMWGVQFHAEVTAEIGLYDRGIPQEWRNPLSFDGIDTTRVLTNFARLLANSRP